MARNVALKVTLTDAQAKTLVNGDSKLIQISFGQRFKTDTPPDTPIAW